MAPTVDTTAAEAFETNEVSEQSKLRKHLERSWFRITMWSLISAELTLTIGVIMHSGARVGGSIVLSGIETAIPGFGMLLASIILGKIGVYTNAHKFRSWLVLFTMVSAVSEIALYALCETVYVFRVLSVPPMWLYITIEFLGGLAQGALFGMAVSRAVQVIHAKSFAPIIGSSHIILLVITLVLMVGMTLMGEQISDNNTAFARQLLLYISIIIVLLAVTLVLALKAKDDFSYTAPAGASYFPDALYPKFLIAAAALLLTDALSNSHYYEGLLAGVDYPFIFQMLDIFLPVVSLAIILILLKKHNWIAVAVGCTLLVCFQQSMPLFFKEDYRLAIAYSQLDALHGYGNIMMAWFIPLALCAQRRRRATVGIAFIAASVFIEAIAESMADEQWGNTFFETPAVTFVACIAAVAYLFYLYSESHRVYIAGLVGFKMRETAQIHVTVSKTDMLEDIGLSPREKAVCALLLKGYSVKQVALELGLAFSTVNGYYRSLYRKLGISSKGELFMRFGAEPAMNAVLPDAQTQE